MRTETREKRSIWAWKNGSMITSIIFIILGVILVLKPGSSLRLLCQIVGGAGLIMGLVGIFYAFCNKDVMGNLGAGQMIGSVILAAAGVFLMTKPEFVASIIPTILGIVILANGLWNLMQTWHLRSVKSSRTGSLIMALLTILAGLVIVMNPFSAASTLVMVTGILLIYNGLSDIWVITRFESDMKNPRIF